MTKSLMGFGCPIVFVGEEERPKVEELRREVNDDAIPLESDEDEPRESKKAQQVSTLLL